MTITEHLAFDDLYVTLEWTPSKDKILQKAERVVRECDDIGRLEYDSGDGGSNTEWHTMWTAYPQVGDSKEDLRNVVEGLYSPHCSITFHWVSDDVDYGFIEARTMVENV